MTPKTSTSSPQNSRKNSHGHVSGLCVGWFREDEVILDAFETLQGQADGAFYPTEHGPKGHTGVTCPDLWGYLDLNRGIPCVLRIDVRVRAVEEQVVYRSAQPSEYRLSQAADCICTMEFTAIKYAEHAATATDEKFFGKWSDFKKGILKETRKKLV